MLKQIMRLCTAWSSVYSQTRLSVMTCAKTLVSGMTFSSPESLHSTTDDPPTPLHNEAQKGSLTLSLSPVHKWKLFHRYTNGCLQSSALNTLAPCMCYHPAKCVTALSLQRPVSYGCKSLRCQCTGSVIKSYEFDLASDTMSRSHMLFLANSGKVECKFEGYF